MNQHKDGACTIFFVNTPCGHTKSMRNLPSSTSVQDLRAILELTTGYPCNTYTLSYGANILDKEDTLLMEEVAQGSVMKMLIKPELKPVLEALLHSEDTEEVFQCCKSVDTSDLDIEPEVHRDTETYNIGKLFFATFLSAFQGKECRFKAIVNKVPQLLSSRTLLGRTLIHASAVSDHPQHLLQICSLAVQQDSRIMDADRFHKTPLDCAKEHNAFLCERLLKKLIHHQRTGTLDTFLIQKKCGDSKPTIAPNKPKKPRAKSAIPARSQSAFSQVSSAYSTTKLKKQVSFETVSSGYQTDENRQSRLTAPSQLDTPSPDLINETTSKPKRVKFKNRVKSAPPKIVSKDEAMIPTNDSKFRPSHNQCFQAKPFMAYREVDPNELRSVSVEYIPMERKTFIGMDARNREKKVQSLLAQKDMSSNPVTPYSSLNNSLQDLTNYDESESEAEMAVKYAWHQSKGNVVKSDDPRIQAYEQKKQLSEKFTYPKHTTTKRAQSAKYYKANYHVRAEEDKYYEDIPRPRPKGAGPKYRAWKPWLIEMYKQQERKRKEEAKNWEKKHQNMVAYREWLKKKQEEEELLSSSDEDDDDDYREGETFENWLKKKRPMLEKMDKKRKEAERQLNNPEKKPLVDRHVTIYELCSTDGIPMKIDSPYTYMRAYQKWKRRKAKYEHWKKKKGEQVDDSELSVKDLREMRKELYLNGFTYNEWLGHTEREAKVLEREKKKVQVSDYVI